MSHSPAPASAPARSPAPTSSSPPLSASSSAPASASTRKPRKSRPRKPLARRGARPADESEGEGEGQGSQAKAFVAEDSDSSAPDHGEGPADDDSSDDDSVANDPTTPAAGSIEQLPPAQAAKTGSWADADPGADEQLPQLDFASMTISSLPQAKAIKPPSKRQVALQRALERSASLKAADPVAWEAAEAARAEREVDKKRQRKERTKQKRTELKQQRKAADSSAKLDTADSTETPAAEAVVDAEPAQTPAPVPVPALTPAGQASAAELAPVASTSSASGAPPTGPVATTPAVLAPLTQQQIKERFPFAPPGWAPGVSARGGLVGRGRGRGGFLISNGRAPVQTVRPAATPAAGTQAAPAGPNAVSGSFTASAGGDTPTAIDTPSTGTSRGSTPAVPVQPQALAIRGRSGLAQRGGRGAFGFAAQATGEPGSVNPRYAHLPYHPLHRFPAARTAAPAPAPALIIPEADLAPAGAGAEPASEAVVRLPGAAAGAAPVELAVRGAAAQAEEQQVTEKEKAPVETPVEEKAINVSLRLKTLDEVNAAEQHNHPGPGPAPPAPTPLQPVRAPLGLQAHETIAQPPPAPPAHHSFHHLPPHLQPAQPDPSQQQQHQQHQQAFIPRLDSPAFYHPAPGQAFNPYSGSPELGPFAEMSPTPPPPFYPTGSAQFFAPAPRQGKLEIKAPGTGAGGGQPHRASFSLSASGSDVAGRMPSPAFSFHPAPQGAFGAGGFHPGYGLPQQQPHPQQQGGWEYGHEQLNGGQPSPGLPAGPGFGGYGAPGFGFGGEADSGAWAEGGMHYYGAAAQQQQQQQHAHSSAYAPYVPFQAQVGQQPQAYYPQAIGAGGQHQGGQPQQQQQFHGGWQPQWQ